MSIASSLSFDEICRRGSIRDADVLKLRQLYYADGNIRTEEAECLFEINDACRIQDPSWAPFFVEAVTDYIVDEAEPQGYLTTDNTEWLMRFISRDGRVETQTEIELLLNVLDKARWSPESLIEYTLAQVKRAVCEGNGPLRTGTSDGAGTVSDADVDLLRRALYAFAGDGNIAITRREAEILFDINDATADSTKNAGWTELFVKAITSSIMAASGYNAPSRGEMLRREAWLESRGDLSLANMVGEAFQGGFSGIFDAYREQSAEERALARLEQQRIEIITNQAVTEGEAAWLAERIGKDGRVTPNEEALIACIREASPKLAPELEALFETASDAA